MSTEPRRLHHPGPASEPRVELVAGRGEVFTLRLPAGATLLDAIAQGLGARGIESAALSFRGLRLDPLVYYLPAVIDAPYLRFGYSDGQQPPGGGNLDLAFASFGRRDGAPFVHCHAVWREADGREHGGHVVPPESVLAQDVEARVAVMPGAALVSEHDGETDYQLFHPVRIGPEGAGAVGPRMAFARIKPNEDLTLAVEAACHQAGFRSATVRGLGSLIGARFTDGTALHDQGSEILVTAGRVAPGEDGAPRADIDICFSGFSGLASRGRLVRGDNPVCITFELSIEERPDPVP